MYDTFSNHFSVDGFTLDEAVAKAKAVNEAYGVDDPNSKWKHATWVPDHDKLSGYKVIIELK